MTAAEQETPRWAGPRLERGIALLDRKHPGWENEIDLDALDLSNVRYCVLGQVYGDFGDGLRQINEGLNWSSASQFGFMAWGRETYPRLTEKWRKIIERRRAA